MKASRLSKAQAEKFALELAHKYVVPLPDDDRGTYRVLHVIPDLEKPKRTGRKVSKDMKVLIQFVPKGWDIVDGMEAILHIDIENATVIEKSLWEDI